MKPINTLLRIGIIAGIIGLIILCLYLFAPVLFKRMWGFVAGFGLLMATLFGIGGYDDKDTEDPQTAADKIIKKIDEQKKIIDESEKKKEDLNAQRDRIISDIGKPKP